VRTHHQASYALPIIASLALLNPAVLSATAKDTTPTTGRVHYRMSSPMMTGTSVVSWIDHGRKFRQDSKMMIGASAQKTPLNTWSIGDGSDLYTYQPALGKQLLHTKVPGGQGGAEPMGGTPFVGSGAGTVVGKATVLGHPCEIRAFGPKGARPPIKAWVWNGVPLRTEMTLPQGQKMVSEATQVETAPKLSPTLFQRPAGYTIKELQMPGARPGAPPSPPR
jgi:hypothetical protein